MVSWDRIYFSLFLTHTQACVHVHDFLCVLVCVYVSASIVLYMIGCLVVVLFIFAIKQEAF